jgi:hypothetical protein
MVVAMALGQMDFLMCLVLLLVLLTEVVAAAVDFQHLQHQEMAHNQEVLVWSS